MAYLEIDEITSYRKDGKFPILYEYEEIKEAYDYLVRNLDRNITIRNLNSVIDKTFIFMEPTIYETIETVDRLLTSLGNKKTLNQCLLDKQYYHKEFRFYLSKRSNIRSCYILDISEILDMLNYIKQNTTSFLEYVLNNKGFNSNMFREYTTYLVNMVARFLDD